MLREVIKVGTAASKGLFFLGRIETGMGDLVGEAHPSLLCWRNIDVRFFAKARSEARCCFVGAQLEGIILVAACVFGFDTGDDC